MALLLDTIREHGIRFSPPPQLRTEQTINATQNVINDLMRDNLAAFDLTDVTREYLEGRVKLSDFPSVRPPYDLSWYESREKQNGLQIAWGMILQRMSVEDFMGNPEIPHKELGDNAAFVHHGILYASDISSGRKNLQAHGPIAVWIVGEDEHGKLCRKEDTGQLRFSVIVMSEPMLEYCASNGWEGHANTGKFLATQYILPLYAGIGFLHVKNISSVLRTVPEKLQKARKRRGKPALVEYRTLTVRPLYGPHNSSKGNIGAASRAVHFCRGHWVEYGEDENGNPYTHPDGTPKGKLFGKYSGKFWIPATIKGNQEFGEIRKDYNVKPE